MSAKRGIDQVDSPAATEHHDAIILQEKMAAWVKTKGGQYLENVRIGSSSVVDGGTGLFASNTISSEPGIILKIPQACVMSEEIASKSFVGENCRRVHGDSCSQDFMFLLYIANGRKNTLHPFHIYIASLPDSPVSAPWWSESERELLKGTNLGLSIEAVRTTLSDEYDQFMPALQKEFPEIYGGFKLADLQLAHDNFFSRRFPVVLSPDLIQNESEFTVARLGIMIPFIDLTNHQEKTQIEWSGNSDFVSFRTISGVSKGQEIFNNYGAKSNEELLLLYGFANSHNDFDHFGLALTLGGENTKTMRLGPFYVKRADERWPQFQNKLWLALSDPVAYSINPNALVSDVPEIDPDDLMMLLHILNQRLEPFKILPVPAEGCNPLRVASILMYLTGQRVVLEEAIQTLEEML